MAGGFEALPDRPHPGQKSALTPEIMAAVTAAMAKRPQAWTARQIADWVADRYALRRSPRQTSRIVGRAQQSYQRTPRGLKQKQNAETVAQKNGERAVLETGGSGCD